MRRLFTNRNRRALIRLTHLSLLFIKQNSRNKNLDIILCSNEIVCCFVRDSQEARTKDIGWRGHALGPPIVVHCSAGIGRTGTFCTLDISIRRLDDVGTIDVKETVNKIRAQRAHIIQTQDQYVFGHLALLEYILLTGRMSDADLTGFERAQEE